MTQEELVWAIEEQIIKRQRHIKRAEALKKKESPKFNEFGYGYEVGWLKALKTIRIWLKYGK